MTTFILGLVLFSQLTQVQATVMGMYENLSEEKSHTDFFQNFDEELKQKAADFEGKVLLDPEVKELRGFVLQGGISTVLNAKGIFWILQASNKVNKKLNVNEISPSIIEIGNKITTVFGTVTRSSTGYFSDQIYKVDLHPNMASNPDSLSYIIKVVRWGGDRKNQKITKSSQPAPIKEIQDLKRVKQVILSKTIELQNKYPFFPVLGVAEDTFFYHEATGEKQYVAVIPLVAGKSASDFLKNALTHNDMKDIQVLMKRIGRALGEFHYHLASSEEQEKLKEGSYEDFKTVTHDDFHLGNAFVGGKISFIDTAGIANSIIYPRSPLDDIRRLFSITRYSYGLYYAQSDQLNDLQNSLHNDFADGYAAAFPEAVRENVKGTLLNYFQNIEQSIQNYFRDYLKDGGPFPPPLKEKNDIDHLLNIIRTIFKAYAERHSKEELESRVFLQPSIGNPLNPDMVISEESAAIGYYADDGALSTKDAY